VKANTLVLAACVLYLPLAGCKSSSQTATDGETGDAAAIPDAAQPDAVLPEVAPDGIATIADVAPSPADEPALTDVRWLDTASDGSDQDNAGCSGWTTLERLSPAEVADLIATSNPIVINVHVPYAGDIPGTDVSIPYSNVDAINAYLNGDLCADVLLVCLGGGMSKSAGDELVKRGYLRVHDLNGGMQAWQAAGYPLLKDGGL
jgi:rhodanese-related sulfurtransferase